MVCECYFSLPLLLICRVELERRDIAHLVSYILLRHHVYFQDLGGDVSAEDCGKRVALSE